MLPLLEANVQRANLSPYIDAKCSKDHMQFMIEECMKMDDWEKKNCWVGFIQGVLTVTGNATVDDFKIMNTNAYDLRSKHRYGVGVVPPWLEEHLEKLRNEKALN